MPELRVRCPDCNAITGTGIVMDAKSFLTSTLRNNSSQCSKCGTRVVWDKKNVILE